MSEEESPGPIHKLKLHIEKHRKLADFERYAKEAVLLLSNSEAQSPLATYYADSPSVFDLTTLKSGAIFRVEGRTSHTNQPMYEWFVVGGIDDKKPVVFQVTDIITHNPTWSSNDTLKLSSAWKLRKIEPTQSSFEIKNSLQSLIRVFDESVNDTFPTTRLDLMAGGKTERTKMTTPGKNPHLVLAPQPSSAD